MEKLLLAVGTTRFLFFVVERVTGSSETMTIRQPLIDPDPKGPQAFPGDRGRIEKLIGVWLQVPGAEAPELVRPKCRERGFSSPRRQGHPANRTFQCEALDQRKPLTAVRSA